MGSYVIYDGLNSIGLLLGIPIFFLLALIIVPVITCFSLLVGIVKKKKFYIQCGYHLTQFGTFLSGIFSFLFFFAIWIYYAELQSLGGIYRYVCWLILGIFYLGIALEVICFVLWNKYKWLEGWYTFLSFLSGICFSSFIIVLIFLLGDIFSDRYLLLQSETDLQIFLSLMFPSLNNPLWLMVFIVHFVEAAAGGGLGLIWLWMRRNKDNFGRDYYSAAAKWYSEWAAYGAWVFLGCFISGILYKIYIQATLSWPIILTSIVLNVCSAVLWTTIACSKAPMRYKLGMICAILFFIYGVIFGWGVLFG